MLTLNDTALAVDELSSANTGPITTLNTALDAESFAHGLCAHLPDGIIKTPQPFTAHDYTLCNPYNMRAVDEMLSGLIISARETMHPDGLLSVVFGESHHMPTHVMAQTGQIDIISAHYKKTGDARFRTILADETPFNALAYFINAVYELPVTAQQTYTTLHKHDPLGTLFARAMLADNQYKYAPQSRNRLMATTLRCAIPLAHIDAVVENMHLDAHDPLAVDMAREHFDIDLEKQTNIKAIDPRGIEIRNYVMARRTLEAANTHKAKIAFISTGRSHLGNNDHKLPFETALPACLVKDRLTGPHDRVLSLFFTTTHDQGAPEKCIPHGSHSRITPVILRGLQELTYTRNFKWLENHFIKELGHSYAEGNCITRHFRKQTIPERFAAPSLPDKEEVRAELAAFLKAHP